MTVRAASETSACHVLIVDDHAAFQERASLLFAAAGCQVVTADDGLAAIEAAHRDRFDLILMDRLMPRCGGDKATVSIRAGSWSQDALIVAHSTEIPRGDEACLYDGIVSKPIGAIDVANLIGAVEARARPRTVQ